MKKKTVLLSLFALCMGSALCVPPTKAQRADLNIGISPPLTHIIIQPGKSALSTVNLENQGNFDVNLTPNFVDFESDNKTGVPVLQEDMSFPYISLQDSEVQLNKPSVLKAGESKQLLFEVALPINSLEKEYHFSLVFDVDPIVDALNDGTSASVTGQIVTNYIVTVSESAQDQGKIQLSAFEAPVIIDSLSGITAHVFMENSGKNTTVTQGDFKIKNMFGKTIFETELLSENILPGSSRQVFGAETSTKDGEEFKTQIPLHYKGLFALGPYKIQLTYHAPSQEVQTFEHTIFALPISVMIFIVVVYILYLIYSRTKVFQAESTQDEELDHE